MKEENNYPEIECKEVHITLLTILLLICFFLPYLIVGLVFLFIYTPFVDDIPLNKDLLKIIIPGIPLLIAFIALLVIVYRFYNYLSVKRNGNAIDATVIGYMNDKGATYGERHVPGQIVKLLIDTEEGKKILLYQLHGPDKKYELNSIVRVKIYNNKYLIEKE